MFGKDKNVDIVIIKTKEFEIEKCFSNYRFFTIENRVEKMAIIESLIIISEESPGGVKILSCPHLTEEEVQDLQDFVVTFEEYEEIELNDDLLKMSVVKAYSRGDKHILFT